MKTIIYLGNMGTLAQNDYGTWAAPGFESEKYPNVRELDDTAAALLVGSGCFKLASEAKAKATATAKTVAVTEGDKELGSRP